MEKVRCIWIGLGGRGAGLLNLVISYMNDVEVVGLCDLYEDRLQANVEEVIKKTGKKPFASTNYLEVMDNVKADCVVTPSSWESHVEICLEAMNRGMYAATEVGGATTLKDCWNLVETSERTGKPCMMLENCCYDRFEMTIMRMVRMGLFGELVHAEGGYRHDLRSEIALGHVNRHYRLNNYMNRNGDLYPTHALGPIAKTFNINRGNRMVSLVSVASKAVGIQDFINKKLGPDFENADYKFAEGDIVTTIIKCAHGETITLTHDTSLYRPYSRGYLIQGTGGIASEDHNFSISVHNVTPENHGWDSCEWRPLSEYYDKYEHPLWTLYRKEGVKAGHGGMDYLVLRAFFEAVRDNTDTPIDVYDTAAWMSITPISEASVAAGGLPQSIPDFTHGQWLHREPAVKGKYCVSEACDEIFDSIDSL